MIRVLLDTDHVSLHERGHLPLRARLASFPPEEVAVSVVTVEEMLCGRLAILARRSAGEARVHAYTKLLETVQFFSTIPVVPFDLACEQQFQALRAMRLRVGSRDLRIAATALVHSIVLIPRNRRDFEQVPGRLLDDWSQEWSPPQTGGAAM
jgi:tRNA(fMet)-specific endonuclease VapC